MTRGRRGPHKRGRRASLVSLALTVAAVTLVPLSFGDYRWGLLALVLAGTACGLVTWAIHTASNATGTDVIALLGSTAALGLYAGFATLMFLP